MSMKTWHVRMRATLGAAAAVTVVLGAPLSSARAQAVIKVSDSVSVRFGILSQTWADWSQNVRQDSSYAQNIFQRRIRFLVGGQIGSHLSFFYETDNPNLGRVTGGTAAGKNLQTGFITQDAYVEVKPGTTNAFLLDAGLLLVPLCRNCQQSAASLLPLDYGSYSFLQGAATGSSVGRDVGFLAKGYLAGNRVEYRAGAFQGARRSVTGTGGTVQYGNNALRAAGRLQVNLLETEALSYTYAGTYFGKKRVFALGVGADAQSEYKAFSGDAFFDYPLGTTMGVTLHGNYIKYDGGSTFPETGGPAGVTRLPEQNTFFVEGGLHLNTIRLTPWAKFEGRTFANESVANQNENRIQAGLTYYLVGHNLNFKAAYTRSNFNRAQLVTGVLQDLPTLHQNGLTFQLQGFYY